MSSNLKVNTILPSTGTTIGIGTVGGLINVVGNIDVNSTSGISTFNGLEISGIVTAKAGAAVTYYGDGSNLTSLPAQATIANNADNRVITGGSGVNLNGEANFVFDGTNLGVGQPNPENNSNFTTLTLNHATNGGVLSFQKNGSRKALLYNDTSTGDLVIQSEASRDLRFYTNGGNERVRIDSTGRTLVSGTLGYGNMPFGGNPANAAIQIRCNSKYNGIAFGENAVSGCIGLGGADTTTAMVFTANAHPANLGGGTKDIFEWWSGNAGGGGPSKYMTLDTGGHLALTSGNLEFANGAGIDFSAVPDGSRSIGTDGNKFDDYEEGSWTPTIQVQSGSFSTFSYQEQQGHYIKVGKLVTIFLRLRLGTVSGSGSGNVYIHSLPYVNHNINNGSEGATFSINYYSHMGGLGNRVPVGYVQQNLSQIVIVSGGQGNGTTSWNANNLNGTNGWQVYGVASYQTA